MEHDRDLLFLDTEFTRLPMPTEAVSEWRQRAILLSVGIAAFDDRLPPAQFYAVHTLNDDLIRRCSSFTRDEVLPQMEALPPTCRYVDLRHLRRQLLVFLRERETVSRKRPLVLVDWEGDAALMEPLLPKQDAFLLLEDIPALDDALLVNSAGTRIAHNALDDAFALRRSFCGALALRARR